MALPKINNAKYTTVVPSTGQTIEFRPYLVKEEKILMMAMESNDQKQILGATKDVITSCVYDDINVDELAMFDIESLFLALRSKSVGERIDLKIKCEECNHMNDIQIDFDDVEIPSVDKEDKVIMLTDDIGITLRYPSYSDVSKIKPGSEDSVDTAFEMIMACIETIFDSEAVHNAKTEGKKAVKEFVESLNSQQFAKISEFFEKMPAVSYDLHFECSNCKTKNNKDLRGIQSFFT